MVLNEAAKIIRLSKSKARPLVLDKGLPDKAGRRARRFKGAGRPSVASQKVRLLKK
jgi:hypothetical protein